MKGSEHQRGVAGDAAQWLGSSVQADQGGGEQRAGGQQPQPGRDALRIEVMGQQQEEAKHDDDHGVAPRTHLHRFERHEEDEQRDAGIASEERAELPGDAGGAGQRQQGQQPACRQRRLALPQPPLPNDQAGGRQRQPGRQMQRVRHGCGDGDGDGDQPGKLAVAQGDGRARLTRAHRAPAPRGRRRGAPGQCGGSASAGRSATTVVRRRSPSRPGSTADDRRCRRRR